MTYRDGDARLLDLIRQAGDRNVEGIPRFTSLSKRERRAVLDELHERGGNPSFGEIDMTIRRVRRRRYQ